MTRTITLLGLTLIVLAAATPAGAQRIEITPFAGYQFGGELAELGDETVVRDLDEGSTWGLMLGASVTAFEMVELAYWSQGTELERGAEPPEEVTVDTLQIGATHEYAPRRPVNPFVGATLGASRFEVAGDSDTRFSAGLALGLKMNVSDHLGFRFDGRILGITTGSGEIGCNGEACFGYPDDSVIWQYGVNVGIIVHLGD
jgi:hypothetical protein